MLATLKATKKVLKTQRRDEIIFFFKTLIPVLLFIISTACMIYVPSFSFLLPFFLPYKTWLEFLFIILAFLPIVYIPSYNEGDKLFLKIMESIELIEEGTKEPELLEKAAKKLEDATKRLDYLIEQDKEKSTLIWHSKILETETEFVEKLKYHAIPALKNGLLSLVELQFIALTFIEPDIKQVILVTNFLEKYPEIIPAHSRVRTLFRDLLYGDLIPLPIVSIGLGSLIFFILLFLYSQATVHDFYGLIYEPKIFIPGILAAIALAHSILKGRKITPSTVEVPEESAIETDDEIMEPRDLPLHTFSVEWNLSGDVMLVPPDGPYGTRDIPNSDSESDLIVNQLVEGIVKIICDMRGLRPKFRYRLAVCKEYTPHSKIWPGNFYNISPEPFDTDSEGCGVMEFNLRSNNFPNPGVHTLSMWLNLHPGNTLLISDNFKVRAPA